MVQKAVLAKEKYNLNSMIINATFIKPLDVDLLKYIIGNNFNVLTIEDNVLRGGLGSAVNMELTKLGFNRKIKSMGFCDKFVEQGSIEELFVQEGLTIKNIKENIDKLNQK